MADEIPTIADVTRLFGLLDPISRSISQIMNRWYTNALPGVRDMVHAFFCKHGDFESFRQAIEAQGAFAPVEIYEAAHVAGDAQFNPRGRAMEDHLEAFGGWPKAWLGVWKTMGSVPGMADTQQLFMRGRIDDQLYEDWQRRNGFYEQRARDGMEWLSRNRMPDPSSLVAFAVKDVWDAGVVDRFGYDNEYPREFEFWMQQAGAAGNADPRPWDQQGQGPNWAQLFWRAHWRNLSPSQAYEMFQRLRENRLDRYNRFIPNLRAFTFEDLERSLRVNDFPAPFRPQLAAIAYKLPRLVDIDRFYNSGTIDENEVYEMHLDRGYSPADARLRTNWMTQQKLTKPQNPLTRKLAHGITELYTLGKLLRMDAGTQLVRLLSGGQITDYAAPPQQNDLVPMWMTAVAAADVYLSEADVSAEIKRTKIILKALRRQFLSGQISESEANAELLRMSFNPAFAQDWIAELKAELRSGRMLLSTERIKKLYVQGIFSQSQAEDYLINLNWKQPERAYLLTQWVQDRRRAQEAEEERQALQGRRAEENAARQANSLRRARDAVIRRLNRQATPAKLMRFFVRGIIDEREYLSDLERRGFLPETIDRLLAEARIERDKYLARRRAAPSANGRAGAIGGGEFGGSPPPPAQR